MKAYWTTIKPVIDIFDFAIANISHSKLFVEILKSK